MEDSDVDHVDFIISTFLDNIGLGTSLGISLGLPIIAHSKILSGAKLNKGSVIYINQKEK